MEESPTKKQHISDEMQLRLASSSQVPASSQLEDTALHHMRHLLNNPEATWTSDEQKAGVLGALDGSKDMVVIARTGSGKTMIPILASLMVPNKFTIVLLPLRALIHDYERRLSTWHVPYQLLTSESINLSPRHSLILVSADLAVRTVFQTAVKVAHQTKQVGLFVFDEGHLVVTDGSYRNALRDANLIRCVPAPLVVLTGTAPPMMVPLIASGLGLVEPYMVIRGPTNRPELKLILRIPQTLQEICNHVEDILLHETPNFQPQDRIIVFVQTKEYGRTLSQRLGCPLYSGDKDDTPDRGGVYNHWIAGDPIMIVATSALYAGNDYGHVRLVIFAGTPSDTLGTFQGLARAGRDTKLATCIILPNTNLSSHRIGTAGIIDFAGVANVLQICKNTPIKCLRSQFIAWCDGYAILCKDGASPGAVCSSCEYLASKERQPWQADPQSQVMPLSQRAVTVGSGTYGNFQSAVDTARAIRQEQYLRIEPLIKTFERGFFIYEGDCTLCSRTWHPLADCPINRMFGNGAFKLSRKLRYPTPSKQQKAQWGSVCFTCHLPQLPGDNFHPEFAKEGSSCQHRDFMLGLVLTILHDKNLKSEAVQELGIDTDNIPTWLTARPQATEADPNRPIYVSNFVRLIVWYLDHYK